MNIELKQTIGHDVMQKEGAKMLADTLCQANGKDVSQMLCGGLELMLNSAVNGFLKNSGSAKAAMELARLTGLLAAMADVVGKMPAIGIRFEVQADDESGVKLAMRLPK